MARGKIIFLALEVNKRNVVCRKLIVYLRFASLYSSLCSLLVCYDKEFVGCRGGRLRVREWGVLGEYCVEGEEGTGGEK